MIVQSFNFFDVNDDGVITKDEIAQLLKIDNADLSEDVLEYMIQQVDTDNDGTVCFEEFVRMLKVWEKDGHIGPGTSGQLIEMRRSRQNFFSAPQAAKAKVKNSEDSTTNKRMMVPNRE